MMKSFFVFLALVGSVSTANARQQEHESVTRVSNFLKNLGVPAVLKLIDSKPRTNEQEAEVNAFGFYGIHTCAEPSSRIRTLSEDGRKFSGVLNCYVNGDRELRYQAVIKGILGDGDDMLTEVSVIDCPMAGSCK